jgi:hypothetical protein
MKREHQTITYKGHEIIFFDYSGLRGKELLEQLQVNTRLVLDAPHNNLLTLSDFRNTYADEELVAYLKCEESKAAAQKTRKKAVLGITGLKKMFLNMYNTFTGVGARAFDNEDAAKEYLIS